MFEKIIDVIKEFIEKHFLPSLLSVTITALVYYITPYNLAIFVKLGKNFYLFTLFCLTLFIVEIIIYILKKLMNKVNIIIEQNKYNHKIEKKNIEYIYNVLDTLTPEEFDLIDYFVTNGNCPIVTYSELHGTVYMDSLFDSRQYKINKKSLTDVDPYNLSHKITYKKGEYVIQFKLKEDIYILLSKIKKKTGKISRF